MSEDHHLALPKGHRLGKYQIERVLGSGGFAITYLAIDVALSRRVAIKELLPADLALRLPDLRVVAKSAADRDSLLWARERFLDEARTIARFEHPNLVRVHEHIEAHDTAYIVMGCVDGLDLNDHLKGKVPASLQELITLIDPLLGALQVMHGSGFLHRDIKPDNIRVTPEGVPVLIDFGSARHAIGSRTRDLTAVLTPRYAPFEQYSEKGNLGPWTDIYSLAGVMHKMLRGTSPPEAPERERNDPYQPLVGDPRFHAYPPSFLGAIDQALHPHETERPQNTEQFRALLWSGVDLPTGFTNVPSGRYYPDPAIVGQSSPPPMSPAAPTGTGGKKKGSKLVPALLAAAACIALGGGLYLFNEKSKSQDTAAADPVTPLINPDLTPEPVTPPPPIPGKVTLPPVHPDPIPPVVVKPDPVPSPPIIHPEKTQDPDPVPTPEPKPPVWTVAMAQEHYRSGDMIFFDIRSAQVRRDSAAERLDGANKKLGGVRIDKQTLETTKRFIVAQDKEVEQFSEKAIERLEQLVKFPSAIRKEAYENRVKDLRAQTITKGNDTRLQQALLDLFYELSNGDSGVRITTSTIDQRVSEVPIPDREK